MPALHDIQSSFAHVLMSTAKMPQIATGHANYSAETALEVYRNNWRGNLCDALTGAYPVIKQLVGEAFFRRLAREYIAHYPSVSGDLHRYGEHLTEFIAGFEPAQSLPYLGDMAALEWICHRAYFAEDATELNIGRLGQVSPSQQAALVLHLHPACHLLRSTYPVAAIWQAHQPGAPEDFRIDLDSGPCNALVIRNLDVVHVDELGDAQADWLQSLIAGSSLGAAVAAASQRHAGFDLQEALLRLVTLGVLTGFSLESDA